MKSGKAQQGGSRVNCRIVHTKTGLFFNGYSYYGKEKNTLSKDNFKEYICGNKSDAEIFKLAFGNNMERDRDEGVNYIRNVIIYKGSEFPLYSSTPIRAIDETKLDNEKPLIVNPIYDNLLELFVLVFRRTSNGRNVLELKPKETTGYLYEKALETIKLFGLGNCEIYRHSNENVYNCRIRILETHFGVFYEFAQALTTGDRRKAFLELRNNKNLFESYGFYKFLKKNQFIVAI